MSAHTEAKRAQGAIAIDHVLDELLPPDGSQHDAARRIAWAKLADYEARANGNEEGRFVRGVHVKTLDTLTPQYCAEWFAGFRQLLSEHPAAIAAKMRWHCCDETRAQAMLHNMAATLDAAQLVLWREEIWNAAIAGHNAFAETLFDEAMLVCPGQVWVFPVPSPLLEGHEQLLELTRPHDLIAFFVMPCYGARPEAVGDAFEDGFVDAAALTGRIGLTVGWCLQQHETPERFSDCLPTLRFYPAVFVGDTVGWATYAVAGMEFLNQKLASAEEVSLPRPYRRRMQKAGIQVPTVRTVVLRHKQGRTEQAAGERRDVEWSCQWLVRGHWRNQWIRGTKDHRPAYVHPHVKGPEDKPLKAPRQNVFLAKR